MGLIMGLATTLGRVLPAGKVSRPVITLRWLKEKLDFVLVGVEKKRTIGEGRGEPKAKTANTKLKHKYPGVGRRRRLANLVKYVDRVPEPKGVREINKGQWFRRTDIACSVQ